MKKLVFVRHAKAEDPSNEVTDFERSLTPKGKATAKSMAGKLYEIDKGPGILISSPAFRALETALIFAGKFGVKPEELLLDSGIYHGMNYKYLNDILSGIGDKTDKVFLFGHNPAFSELPDSLCRQGCDYLSKCGIAGISFNISTWAEIKPGTGKLEYFLKPE